MVAMSRAQPPFLSSSVLFFFLFSRMAAAFPFSLPLPRSFFETLLRSLSLPPSLSLPLSIGLPQFSFLQSHILRVVCLFLAHSSCMLAHACFRWRAWFHVDKVQQLDLRLPGLFSFRCAVSGTLARSTTQTTTKNLMAAKASLKNSQHSLGRLRTHARRMKSKTLTIVQLPHVAHCGKMLFLF